MDKLPFEKITRTLIVKREATTSPKYGKKPELRTAEELLQSGIVVIDKPSGPTSHQVSAYVKHILGLKKAGHSGTLDPKVTGVLPVAIGKGTRIVQALLPAGKEYIALMQLHKDADENKIRAAMGTFTGKIKQLPPVKSAIKRELRERNVYYIEIISIKEKFVLFKVGCQAGTYIRKLIHDMGVELNINAQMAELRRTKAGPFKETDLVTLQELNDAYYFYKTENNPALLKKCVKPIETATNHLPKVYVMDTTVDSLCHGAQLKVPGISSFESGIEKDQECAIMTLKGELIATGRAKMSSKEMEEQEKGIAMTLSQVFMNPGTYPRIDKV